MAIVTESRYYNAMKLEDLNGAKEWEAKEVVYIDVTSGEKRQRLGVVMQEEPLLLLTESGVRLRSWPLHAIRLSVEPSGSVTVEGGGETLVWQCSDEASGRELNRAAAAAAGARPLSEAALGALLEDAAASDADADAEQWVRRLRERLARLDALNVGGMLAAATEGGGAGARLAERLDAGGTAGAALGERLRRADAVTRTAPDAAHARSGAARADSNARALLAELQEIYRWLDPPVLRNLESPCEVSLASAEGRAQALEAAEALRAALEWGTGEGAQRGRGRLGAVRERLRRLTRAREQLAAALARHLNNALIHLGNSGAQPQRRHHAELRPYAPFMRWLKAMDEKAYGALLAVYVSTWARAYEREVHAAAEAVRAQAPGANSATDEALDAVLALVENLCNAEQDFCTHFFHLGDDKADSEIARRLQAELFPALEAELVALVAHTERQSALGAMRALACVGRRVVGDAGEGRWARAALAAAAVAAKRGADRAVAERVAALPDALRQAARRPKCGVLSFVREFEELSAECEAIFGETRRGDVERWYASLLRAMLGAIETGEHPRTPRAVLQLENYHRLHAAVSALRTPALEPLRRECRARYAEALRRYVAHWRPLERLAAFFDGVAEAVAAGAREEEVCFRAAFSKHEVRRLLALYPAAEVRRSLHRLYRSVEKQLSEEGGLLQVVWRAMQEQFIAQHVALQVRLHSCYAGAGLSMPLTTQDILDAFSDIAQQH